MSDLSKSMVIVLGKNGSNSTACLKGHMQVQVGKNDEEAIGALMLRHSSLFNLNFEYKDS